MGHPIAEMVEYRDTFRCKSPLCLLCYRMYFENASLWAYELLDVKFSSQVVLLVYKEWLFWVTNSCLQRVIRIEVLIHWLRFHVSGSLVRLTIFRATWADERVAVWAVACASAAGWEVAAIGGPSCRPVVAWQPVSTITSIWTRAPCTSATVPWWRWRWGRCLASGGCSGSPSPPWHVVVSLTAVSLGWNKCNCMQWCT